VQYLAGDLHFHAGEPALAVPFFERALALDPGWTPAADHLVDCFQQLGRRDEMLAVAERAAQARPGENSRLVIWARLDRNEPGEAIALARRQAQGGDPDAVDMFINVLQWDLRLAEAEVEARKLLAPEVPPDQRVEAWHALAKNSLLHGREAEALSRLRAATDEKASRSKAIHAWDTYTTLAILRRDRPGIERGLAAVQRLGAPFHRYASYLEYSGEHEWAARIAAGSPAGEAREYWEAYVAWHRGDLASAERTFRRLNFTYEFAQLLAEQGRDGEVAALLVRRPSTYWMSIPETWILARYRVLLARSLHRLGRDEEARAELDRFLEPLDRPDPDWAPLQQAKALGAELGRAPPRAATR
jgi:tetratricopeptide (TPR) repeat protein